MDERIALEIASRLEALMPIAGRSAVKALRQQHAEIDRLTSINSALAEKGNSYVIENARRAEEIERLIAERDAAIAAAVDTEREACAAICDRMSSSYSNSGLYTAAPRTNACSKDIRARSAE